MSPRDQCYFGPEGNRMHGSTCVCFETYETKESCDKPKVYQSCGKPKAHQHQSCDKPEVYQPHNKPCDHDHKHGHEHGHTYGHGHSHSQLDRIEKKLDAHHHDISDHRQQQLDGAEALWFGIIIGVFTNLLTAIILYRYLEKRSIPTVLWVLLIVAVVAVVAYTVLRF